MAFQQLIFYHRKLVLSIEKIKKVTLNNFFGLVDLNGVKMLIKVRLRKKIDRILLRIGGVISLIYRQGEMILLKVTDL